jgi:hypothetical protein
MKDCRLRWCVLAALLLSIIPAGLCAQSFNACGPAPAVKAALDQIPSYQAPLQTDWQYEQQRLSAIRALLQQYPDDVFVLRTYFDLVRDPDDRDKLVEEFKARHEKNPDDPLSSYLYGCLLVGRDSPQATKLFESAMGKAPQFPWPHYSLVAIYNSRNFLNKDQAVSHLKAFLNLCPESLEGYSRLADRHMDVNDTEMIRQSAVRLRALLQSRSDPDALGAYSTLWSLEFKTHPASEYDALRKQVGEDLRRLRALNLQDKPQWYEALEEGYKLANDQKQSDWARGESERRFPTPYGLPAMSKWEEDHKYPQSDAPADKKREYYSEYLKQSAEWVKERPNTAYIWSERVFAMEYLDEVPAAEVEAAVDKVFHVAKANAGPRDLASYYYLQGAAVLSEKGLQPERVVEMAQKGLTRLEVEGKQPPSDLYTTKEYTENNKFYRASQLIQGLELEADGYVQLKQADKAQILLAQLDERLQDLKILAGDKKGLKEASLAQESSYWRLMGRLAELQNRKPDAMAFYEEGLLKRLGARRRPETGVKDELAENARTLWKSLGGTDEGWRVWYGRQADALLQQATLTWEEANLPLPSFQLADLHGKTWQVADLKGKVTFLNFWASW